MDSFIFDISYEEKDRDKRDKLSALQLTEAEWDRIDLFQNVLQMTTSSCFALRQLITCGQSAQNAQHAFSADLRSTLHLAIPALEKLHAEWTAKSAQPKYSVFHDALGEALSKVDEYYQKTSNSNSYMFAMGTRICRLVVPFLIELSSVLDPRKKLSYFEKHWPKALQKEANKNMEDTVRVMLCFMLN